ncbi:unnamed protein product [Victoria cruziana]
MGKRKRAPRPVDSDEDNNLSVSLFVCAGLRDRHQLELDNLTLTTQPFKTLKYFILATLQYLKQSVVYILTKGGWLLLLLIITFVLGQYFLTADGPYEKHVQEFLCYLRYGVWWLALGVASSIGLGSGLHTFVLYLGPHIALFTIKSTQCGRVDLKAAPYDTIQLKRSPSWLEKDCAEFGPPTFPLLPDTLVRVPVSSILPQVQIEAILWGIGTALGELPPYFISRAARISGSRLEDMEEWDPSSRQSGGLLSGLVRKTKRWLLSHSQHLNFLTILGLASVPNPLFDLAGIMCGQFAIPFWEFFLATLFGKALIKTHIQTIFIILVCNNQLLELIEKELIWILGFVPGLSFTTHGLIANLQKIKDKYLAKPAVSNIKGKEWNFSFTTIWNAFIWLMLINFFSKIVSSTAQKFLKRQQDKEIAALVALQSNGQVSRAS